MRQGFTIELTDDEEITFSTVENSNKVRLNAEDEDGECVEIELSIRNARELRSALDKAITAADNPYSVTINSGAISAQSLINDYYASLLRTGPSYGRFF